MQPFFSYKSKTQLEKSSEKHFGTKKIVRKMLMKLTPGPHYVFFSSKVASLYLTDTFFKKYPLKNQRKVVRMKKTFGERQNIFEKFAIG